MRACVLLLTATVGLSCSDTAKKDLRDQPGPLRAGTGLRQLELPPGHSTAGYAQSPLLGVPRPADEPGSAFTGIFPATRGQQSPPTARALVLDNGVNRLVLARIDAIFVTDQLLERVVDLAKNEAGIDLAGRLILNATHTHDAGCRFSRRSLVASMTRAQPEGGKNALAHGVDTYSQESTDRVARAVALAAKEAVDTLRPAKVGYARSQNRTAGHDRRCENDDVYGSDFIDPTVTVLRVDEAESGRPIAVAFHYGLHGTIYGEDNRSLSVDAPGHAEFAVEESFDTPMMAMFLQGSGGDVAPSGGPFDGSQAMRRAALDLAQSVVRAREAAQTRREVPLQVLARRVPMTFDGLGYRDGEFEPDGAILCQYLHGGCPPVELTPDQVSCMGAALEGQGKYTTAVAAARIGDLALVTLPGEPMSAVGMEAQKYAESLGFAAAIAVGYAQDHNGYILFAPDWLRGGYEPTISFWGWRFADYVVAQAVDVLRELKTGTAVDKRPVAEPDLATEAYEPVKPADSVPEPGVIADVPEAVQRLDEVEFAFHGGDPAFGTPEVVLEKKSADGSWGTVLQRGWLPVSNLRGGDVPVFYESIPTFASAPKAASRDFRWTAHYEPPIDLAQGTYRLHARGRAQKGGVASAYDAASREFVLSPATMKVEAVSRVENGKLIVEATLLYPAKAARWSDIDESHGWQRGGFRMVDPRFPPNWVPATAGAAGTGKALLVDDGAEQAPVWIDRPVPAETRWAPGAGPGFRVEFAVTGAGPFAVSLPAGLLADSFGNANAATSVP